MRNIYNEKDINHINIYDNMAENPHQPNLATIRMIEDFVYVITTQ